MFPSKIKILCGLVVTFLAIALWFSVPAITENVYQYESMGRRDPFIPLVGVTLSSKGDGLAGILGVGDISVEGVMVDRTTGEKNVIINGEILKKGDKIGRLAILEIGYNSVRISIESDEYELELYE